MPNQSLMLPTLMQHLKPLTSTLGAEAQVWGQIFASHTQKQALHSGSVSRFVTGERPIPHPYIKYYADIDAPHEPSKLFTDLSSAMETIGDVPSSTQKMIDALIVYIDTYVDPIDRPGLMPAEQPRFPTQADAAKLWTRVLWYTMCHDYATT